MSGLKRFFCGGYNKSGTTFLQQLLNTHPTIHVPPEHQLNAIRSTLETFNERYPKALLSVDRRTARQGVHYSPKSVMRSAYRGILDVLFETNMPDGTTHTGINDNMICFDWPFHLAMYPEARHIFIVRDPREVAGSLHHHKTRTEKRFRENPPKREDWLYSVGRSWRRTIVLTRKAMASPAGKGKIKIIQYEDLIGPNKVEALCDVLKFLQADADPKVAEEMLLENDFDKAKERTKKKSGKENDFFKRGASSSWVDTYTPTELACVEKGAEPVMEEFGYERRATVTVKISDAGTPDPEQQEADAQA